jgi:hypothetical protein
MKINMQAALSSEDISEAIADFVSEKTGSTVSPDDVELSSNDHGIWAQVTVEAEPDALTPAKTTKRKTPAKRAAPKLAAVQTEEPETVPDESGAVIEEPETPEVSETSPESDNADESPAEPEVSPEETLSELKAAASGKANIFNKKKA